MLTLGFGVIGLCSAFGGRGGEPLIALLLIGAAIAFGLGIIRLVRSIWRLFREPQA